jgi:hypothetical protein
MPTRLMMWFCRVTLRVLKSMVLAQITGSYHMPAKLEREFNDLMSELNTQLWPPHGEPPKTYED